ncbi:MAG: hypothetical protein DRO93_08910 [Candidatus Thorarchaeota archaeon]|nr:MAG: hypothetical protein DRO93_08910 [Candidatus Thorarchaeota archaeon]
MDSHKWRRELDRLFEIKGMLVIINPALEEQTDRQMRQLYDAFAKLTRVENELSKAGFIKKRKLQSALQKAEKELEDDYMRTVRDLADMFRKEHRAIISLMPKIQALRPAEAKALATVSFPSVGAGDFNDARNLYDFAAQFSKRYAVVHQEITRDVKTLLDENKGMVDTYERHVTIDRGEVATTVATDDVSGLPLSELVILHEKLTKERAYLDGRKGEVSGMLGTSLLSDIEALQASVTTASRLGLDLPVDFTHRLRLLARDASSASDLTTLLTLESQLRTAEQQMANLLRDRIINMKHEITTKIVEGGIPTTADVIPPAPVFNVETDDVASLLLGYQKMVEWEGQVRIALKDKVQEILEELQRATDAPEDTGVTDVLAMRQFIANSMSKLETADIDVMVRIYSKAKAMHEEAIQHITEKIRDYLARFNELATSADRVLDYAQLSKKAPKVEELRGGIVYLLESLNSLRNAVDSGVATFRDACLQEIDAIIQDLQTIKPSYAEIFMPITADLEQGAEKIKRMHDFGEIRSEMKAIKEGILVKAKEALENLRYRLGVKIRLAAAKLMGAGVEIPSEVQEAIAELNSVGVAADNVFSLPTIARKMVELYEKKISSKIIETLLERVDQLLQNFEQAKSIGVDVESELEILHGLKEHPPRDLEEAADAFDKLMSMTTSPTLHSKIRKRADEAYVQIKGAVSIFEKQGLSEFVGRLKMLLEKVPEQLEQQSKHINEALDVCLTLASVQDEMLSVIKSVAAKDAQQFDQRLRSVSNYYSTIERVMEKYPKDFSRVVYPVERIKELEEKLKETKVLDEALQYFEMLKELREGWVAQVEKMDDWHKSLRMYLTGFSPTMSPDAREKFLDEQIKRIRETFSREDISSYLSWALREIADSMVKAREE